jgi:hypothetical protein
MKSNLRNISKIGEKINGIVELTKNIRASNEE